MNKTIVISLEEFDQKVRQVARESVENTDSNSIMGSLVYGVAGIGFAARLRTKLFEEDEIDE